MSDSLRTDRPCPHDAASDLDRDAKIEQLLLLGLDHYFAAQYDQAINVWTRALFLDRSHPRARAYIERARSALAERQRKSEELLHTGVAAFERGEGGEARRLLHAAIDGGATPDEALAVLDRLDRLKTAAPRHPPAPAREGRRPAPGRRDRRPSSKTGLVLAVSAAIVLAVGGSVAVTRLNPDWLGWVAAQGPPPLGAIAPLTRDVEPPPPRRGEAALARAQALVASGHLRDALVALDAVRATDPQKPDADILRATIQRALLALTASPDAVSLEPARDERRGP